MNSHTTHWDVVGLGSCTLDVLTLVDHLPEREEVQQAAAISMQGGGPVATALVTLARLGARTAILDALGDDPQSLRIRHELQVEGVDTAYLLTRPGCTATTACILVDRGDASRTILYTPGSAPEPQPAEIPPEVIRSARFVHLNGRHWDACLHIARLAHQMHVPVSMDGGAGRYRPEVEKLVALADVCIVAHDFAVHSTGQHDPQLAASLLLQRGPSLVAVTAGRQGSWVVSRSGERFHQPAFLLPDTVDTTGCGDSYHGAFLYGLLQDWPLHQVAVFASAVAALNSRTLGGRAGLPHLSDVMAFLALTPQSVLDRVQFWHV